MSKELVLVFGVGATVPKPAVFDSARNDCPAISVSCPCCYSESGWADILRLFIQIPEVIKK